MSSEEAKKFREAQRRSDISSNSPTQRRVSSRPTYQRAKNVQLVNTGIYKREENKKEKAPTSVYTAPAGTAHAANNRKKTLSPRLLKFLAILLSASIGVGSVTYAVLGNSSKAIDIGTEASTITQLESQGINTDKIGLQEDTLELLEKYDEIFTNFDFDKATELSETDIINMAKDIELLNFNTIKDKVADLTGVSRDDITLRYKYETGDGTYNSSVIINEGEYDEVRYNNINGIIFGIGEQNGIPDEIAKLIIQTREYDDIIEQLKSDKITKRNAIEELRKLYMNISENVATKDFIMNNGEIVITDYSEQIKNQQDREEER